MMRGTRKCGLLLIWVFLFTLLVPLAGQNISVTSFRALPDDLTARVEPITNENGKKCALVRIVTTERGFEFDTDLLGLCTDVDESHAGEVWIWLAPGSNRITIRHAQLGVLRNYIYPVPIESACVYEMVLATGRVHSYVEEQNRSNFLALTITPPEAMVKIDGEVVTIDDGQLSSLLPVGEHRYEAYCTLYHPKSGTFTILPDKKTVLDLELLPHHGFLQVLSEPEQDATVFVDGSKVGSTPYLSDRLSSGDHTVQVAKSMYKNATAQVTVKDGQTSEVVLALAPNFAVPYFICKDEEAEIWVNGEKKGTGEWSGRLPVGTYRVEVRKASHRPIVRQLVLELGDSTSVVLDAPTPIEGNLQVNSTPIGADILLDGQKVGTTPEILNHVLVGRHELKVTKEGFVPDVSDVTVEEGQQAEVSVKLNAIRSMERPLPTTGGDAQGRLPSTPALQRTPLKLFFTLNAACSASPQWSFGFRIGTLRLFGGNISLMSNFHFKALHAKEPEEGQLYVFSEKKASRLAVTAGVTCHPATPVLLFLNVGYGFRSVCYQSMSDNEYYRYSPHSLQGAELSMGLMANIRGLLLSVEVETLNFKYVEFKFGMGGLINLQEE